MINKINFKGSKPQKYYMNDKRVKRMVLNDDVIYEYVPCTGINIVEESISMPLEGNVGDTYNINYTVSPSDCTEPVKWSIGNNNYFSISNGVITRLVGNIELDVEELNITVTVTCESFSDTTKLKLINDGSCISFRFNEKSVNIDADVIDASYYKLKYIVSPDNCKDEVTYELSNPNIIKVVHSKGTKEFWITTLSIGKCTITGRCGNKSDTCVVEVVDNTISCTGITLRDIVIDGYSSAPVNYTITPSGCDEPVSFSIADRSVATMTGTHVYGKSVGTTTITGTCGNYSDTANITVNRVPCTSLTCYDAVTVDFENVSPTNGGGVWSGLSVQPSNTTDVVTCTVHNNDMVYVQQQSNGSWYIYSQGRYYGTTVITFKCGGVEASCYVTVQ